jgi:mersacidin/lichenicidin family type 2 lantibiotic
MSALDIIRAWKDEAYRMSLTPEELAQLPENPVGPIELTDTELGAVAGGEKPTPPEPDPPTFPPMVTRTLSICGHTKQSPCKTITKDHTCDPEFV